MANKQWDNATQINTSNFPKLRIFPIDALRGIAAMCVVIYHYTKIIPGIPCFNFGCMGVDLFFVISGFVIFLTIQNNQNWQEFLTKRFTRLYPAYWICVTLSFFSSLVLANPIVIESKNILAYVSNLTMFQHYLKTPHIDGSYWTLTIELVFYSFIFSVLVLKKKHHILTFSIILLLLSGISGVCYTALNKYYLLHFTFVLLPLIGYFPLFLSGILFYQLKSDSKNITKHILLVFCFFIQILLFNNFYYNKGVVTFNQYIIGLTFIYSMFYLYLYQGLDFLVNAFTIKLGAISYCLYLLHLSIGINIIIPLISSILSSPILILLVSFTIILMISLLIHQFLEIPLMSYLRSKLLKKPFKEIDNNDTSICYNNKS